VVNYLPASKDSNVESFRDDVVHRGIRPRRFNRGMYIQTRDA